ncbi:hypothetical protein B0H13DRAFT_2460439 [Mycena leptocephala]|nr:hypothetical protein B0H13DRAFT_2460439 [Mycena leptocephala]
MNNTLQELRAYIKASGFELCPAQNHARIHQNLGFVRPLPFLLFLPGAAYIATSIMNNPKSLFKRRVPPLDIIFYAIRCLLARPDARRLRDIPDLLDFATTIEFYRVIALQRVQEALKIHQYYQANDDRPVTLTDEEADCLREYNRNDPTVRTIHIETVLQYCQLDIYHLWMSDPPCTADVTLCLSEYFPQLYRTAGGVSPRLFHYDLSDAEHTALRVRALDCSAFVSDSQTLANVFQTPEFLAALPCEIQLSELRKSMDFYTALVERMVNELQEIFPAD